MIETDGRELDPLLAELTGEASHQRAGQSDPHFESIANAWESLPAPRRDDPTYYDRPILKAPVWKPYIPLYYFVGGAAGAAFVLGAAAQFDGSRDLDTFVRRCHWIGIVGSSIGGVFLIADLGRPERFLAMLRVFRPTSPMNVGAWVLAVAPTSAFTAGLFARTGGVLNRLGEAAGITSGVFGASLATYTGVLVANTAVPLWQESRRILPILFGASAMASAAAIYDIFFDDPRGRRVTYTFGLTGRIAEMVAASALERQTSVVPRVGRPLHDGLTGYAWRAATVLTTASLIATVFPVKSRKKHVVAGILGAAGSLLVRFAVHYAGMRSARDPRATFHHQRAGHGSPEL